MKRIALLGLGQFNRALLTELFGLPRTQIIVVDRDDELVELYKDKVAFSYIADVSDEHTLQKVVTEKVDAAVVDLGEQTGAAVLVVNNLKKIGVEWIVAKAETDRFARVLKSVGVHQVILPGWDAARRIAPQLLLSSLKNFLPISEKLVLAEVIVPPLLVGESIITGAVRVSHQVNVIAVRTVSAPDYAYVSADYRFTRSDIVLVTGSRVAVSRFAGEDLESTRLLRKESLLKRAFSEHWGKRSAVRRHSSGGS